MRAGVVGVLIAGLLFGLGSEWVAYGWQDPADWVPDLLVGLVWTVCGVRAERYGKRLGVLFVAVAFTWFLGGCLPFAVYWHRGVLVHLLVAYPGRRPASRLVAVAVAAGYAAVLLPFPWQNDVSGALLALVLVGVLVRLRAAAVGRERHGRTVALRAGALLGLVLAGGSVARIAVPRQEAIRPVLLVFEAVLCGIALLLLAGLRRPASTPVTDLVVELGESRRGALPAGLARLLGDPHLVVGYWVPATGVYVDGEGRSVVLPPPGAARCATWIEREGRPFAVVVHDIAVREESQLVAAVAAAHRLTASNAALQAEVRARLYELTASRRRLVVAANGERARLEERLRHGAERRLRDVQETLEGLAPDDEEHPDGEEHRVGDEEHRTRAMAHLVQSLEELLATARGLHPRELADGIGAALSSLRGVSTVPVQLSVSAERFPAEVEAAVYYVCAEAVTNAAKHSLARTVSITVRRDADGVMLEIEDDGTGGADPARGTGLVGVADRIAALGGELTMVSPPGAGTRLLALIPLAAGWTCSSGAPG
ncbi:sensor histidine kinase [Streptomyces sp. NPDC006602]|uniref:sensor histidine kinase n=1 Tax=Streptomyces sp. NPDC006602 TaxID=3364751 RepID=UPI0036CB6E66